jgi:hypothetical protein
MATAFKVEPIPVYKLYIGHIVHHNGKLKIVDTWSADTVNGVHSVRVVFEDCTQMVIPYPDNTVTVEIVTVFY